MLDSPREKLMKNLIIYCEEARVAYQCKCHLRDLCVVGALLHEDEEEADDAGDVEHHEGDVLPLDDLDARH